MKRWIIPVISLFVLGGFLWREYAVSQLPVPLISVEKNVILLRVGKENVFGMGRIDSPRAKALSRGMLSFFAFGKISSVWDIQAGQELRGENFLIQRVSKNLVRSICSEQVMWWIGDEFSEKEVALAIASGVDFASNFWVMNKNSIPEFLPLPRQGILYGGDRMPSKKTRLFAQKREISLISVKETGGFALEYVIGEGWELKVRK